MIGQRVKLKIPMLGNPAGTVGYVFNEYADYDGSSVNGKQIIFANGEYDGFSAEEQVMYLEMGEVVPDVAVFRFKNVMQVTQEYRDGFWDFGG